MPTPFVDDVVCAACGAKCSVISLGSTSQFGSPDLDTRPPPPDRGTLEFQVQHCPACNYCAPDVSESAGDIADILASHDYLTNLKDERVPETARRFLCWSSIAEHMHQFDEAMWAAMRAAWVCDDAEHAEQARRCRMRAIGLLKRAADAGQAIGTQTGSFEAILVDVQRRCGLFDDAQATIARGLASEPGDVIRKVLLFQERLVQSRDIGCHTIAKAVTDVQ